MKKIKGGSLPKRLGNVGLKLSILPPNIDIKAGIVDKLKNMTKKDCIDIYDGLKKSIQRIDYSDIFIIKDREMIFVRSIYIDDLKIPINMAFYKSTGTSRSSQDPTSGICFPTTGLSMANFNNTKDGSRFKVNKLEPAKYINDGNSGELIKYIRFINEINAL